MMVLTMMSENDVYDGNIDGYDDGCDDNSDIDDVDNGE